MNTNPKPEQAAAREGMIPVGKTELYSREIGQGQPIIILHGGPDFNHEYLLPEMDRLSDSFRLIYYDQRGRGKSGGKVRPEEVSIELEIEDLEGVRKHFGLESTAVLGHSWGGLLAMEYAIRHPERVSQLILMNSGPASHDDYMLLRQEREKNATDDLERLKALRASIRYKQGDLKADAAYYRIHFRGTIRQAEQLERVVNSLRVSFNEEGILKARAIEKRLMEETWLASAYDLLPRLKELNMPTLVIHGEHDIVPVMCAAHIALAVPGARFSLLRNSGHFSFIEKTEVVGKEVREFLQR
jgi:proline iminopeptidase